MTIYFNRYLIIAAFFMSLLAACVYSADDVTPTPNEKPKGELKTQKAEPKDKDKDKDKDEKESKIPRLRWKSEVEDRSSGRSGTFVPIELVPSKPQTHKLPLTTTDQYQTSKNKYLWLRTSAGNHKSWNFDVMHGAYVKRFSYNLGLKYTELGPYRGEDESSEITPEVALSTRIGENFYLMGRARYDHHKLQMPGPEFNNFSGFERKNDFMETELMLEYRGAGSITWQASIFGDIAKLGREDLFNTGSIKDSRAGSMFLLKSGEHWNISGRVVYEDMEDIFDRTFGEFGITYAGLEFAKIYSLSLGAKAFLFESIQARFAPFLELKALLSPRDTLALILDGEHSVIDFEQTYLHTNYAAVNTNELPPQGKTNLRLVYSRSFDKGYEVSAGLFFRREQDLMLWDYDSSIDMVRPVLADRADFYGVNIHLKWAVFNSKHQSLDLYCDYEYEDWRNHDDSIETISYSPKQNATFGIRWRPYKEDDKPHREIALDIAAKYVGSRYDDIANANSLSGFFVYNAELSFKYSERFKIFLRGENILDNKYYLVRGYPERRAVFLAGFELHF